MSLTTLAREPEAADLEAAMTAMGERDRRQERGPQGRRGRHSGQ
jgi:hypothetical protein